MSELPCKFETFSGVCLICGAEIGEECEVERERNRAMRQLADYVGLGRAPTMKEVAAVVRKWRPS
jgi:hypothetical protein